MEIGFLCGYVGVGQEHPLYENSYDGPDLAVHGGLTFSGNWLDQGWVWWFGFDCGHFMDFMPALHAKLRRELDETGLEGTTYKTIGYVQEECRRLAAQLSAIG